MKIEIYLDKKLVDRHDVELKQFQVRAVAENYNAFLKDIDHSKEATKYYFERKK